MKQIQKIIIAIIGMVAMCPVALGKVADAPYTPTDTLYFTNQIGCTVIYEIIDFATMFKRYVPLSGEERSEALQLLKDAINDPQILGDYFELEVGIVPNVDDFTVIGPENDESNEEDDQSDHALRMYFSEYTIIIEWIGAGFTTLNKPEKKDLKDEEDLKNEQDLKDEEDLKNEQYLKIGRAIEMYYMARHEYEVSQTPWRYWR